MVGLHEFVLFSGFVSAFPEERRPMIGEKISMFFTDGNAFIKDRLNVIAKTWKGILQFLWCTLLEIKSDEFSGIRRK